MIPLKRTELKQHSNALGRDMNVFVYGTKGYPVIVFPTQDGLANQYEDFGMVDELADLVEGGKIQLFCIDSVDKESWSDGEGDKEARAAVQEAYYTYVVDELVPFVQKQNKSKLMPLTTGCSMGATHAAIVTLRRPDLFQGCIALSGCYDAKYFFGGWMNETLYDNSPVHFMENLPADHPYVELLSKRDIIFCVGQGAWEDEGVRTTALLERYFAEKGIDAWFDFWGYDVNHDWPWWKKQITYFMPIVLEDIEKQQAEAAAAKKPARKPAAKKAEPKAEAEADKEPAAAKKAEPKKVTTVKVTTAKKPAAKTTKAAATKAAAAATTAAVATAAATAAKKAPAAKAAKAAATKAAAATTAAAVATTAAKTAATKATAAKKTTAAKTTATKTTAAKTTAAKTTAAKTTAAKKTTTRKATTTKAATTKSADEPKVTKLEPSKAVQEALANKAK